MTDLKSKISLSKICTFDLINENSYCLSMQRYGGLNSFSLRRANESIPNALKNTNTNYLNVQSTYETHGNENSNLIGFNRSLMTKVSLTIIIIAIIVHTVATYIAATSHNLM